MKPNSLDVNQQISLSACCNKTADFMVPSLGEPGCYFCRSCHKECKTVLAPVYRKIDKGTYRKIQY